MIESSIHRVIEPLKRLVGSRPLSAVRIRGVRFNAQPPLSANELNDLMNR
jgi:hypothetical protein